MESSSSSSLMFDAVEKPPQLIVDDSKQQQLPQASAPPLVDELTSQQEQPVAYPFQYQYNAHPHSYHHQLRAPVCYPVHNNTSNSHLYYPQQAYYPSYGDDRRYLATESSPYQPLVYPGHHYPPVPRPATPTGCCLDTTKLLVFHTLNALLGYGAFTVLISAVCLSVSLIPIFCIGLLGFRLMLYGVFGLAQLDVALYNYIALPDQYIYMRVPPHVGVFSGKRLAPSLKSFSPLSLMALIYFLTIKFGVAFLSSVVLSVVLAAPLSLLYSMMTDQDVMFSLTTADAISYKSDPVEYLVCVVCLTVIGVALMHVVAKLSLYATQFFCCERVTTYYHTRNGQDSWEYGDHYHHHQHRKHKHHHHHRHHRHHRECEAEHQSPVFSSATYYGTVNT